jgi:hypothetical protein
MNSYNKEQGLVGRFCGLMGRQHFAARFLDWVMQWIVPFTPRPAFGVVGAIPVGSKDWPQSEAQSLGDGLLLMANLASGSPDPSRGLAPSTPHAPHAGRDPNRPGFWSWLWSSSADHNRRKTVADQRHATTSCADPKYRGMHGRPCKFAGGSDNRCPRGTTSGWFWSYETSVGRVYYVDCCGGTPDTNNNVWCNWTEEPDWCLHWGRAHNNRVTGYNCTLAILDADMRTVQPSPGVYEVSGVDP